ncbi:MAG TPA: DUF1018 domain-containing protein, partial [Leptospiraceae bacterium]|nr:DUF1018 domain-containing protein [Leptospiraceae bacterium]
TTKHFDTQHTTNDALRAKLVRNAYMRSQGDTMEPKKLRTIFAYKKELQLTEEELYLHLNLICKKDSISKLSDLEADKFIRSLRSKLPKKPAPTRKYKTIRSKKNPNIVAIATREQREYLSNLLSQINSQGIYKLTLEGMSQRQFKKSEKLLTRNDARILTEAAKNILRREVVG